MGKMIKLLVNLVLAGIAVGITFGVLFLMNGGWQKKAVEALMERDAGRDWQVESVSMGLNHVELGGLFMLDRQVGVEVGRLSVEGPLWRAPLDQVVKIRQGEVRGLFVDLSKWEAGEAGAEEWASLLERARTDPEVWEERLGRLLEESAGRGWEVRLENVWLEGEILLPGGALVPMNWKVVRADSGDPGAVEVEFAEEGEAAESGGGVAL